ncbi:MAG: hypothetical protein HQ521_01435 [Bacteroidetes bacterium]|nr:hypothetical protein [Bacteroidota bacterium]
MNNLFKSIVLIIVICTSMNLSAQWGYVGSPGFSAWKAYYPEIAIDGSGTQYVVYKDAANSSKATVMKFNGTSWVIVGNAGFTAGNASYVCIAIDGGGTPYVAYSDQAYSNKTCVMKFNGSAWVNVGASGFSTGRPYDISIAINGSGTPYVVYQDELSFSTDAKATVKKFNGSSWVTVGTESFSKYEASYCDIAIDGSGTPYVVYQDRNWPTSAKATVMKFNGSAWVNVGIDSFSAGDVYGTSIAINSSGTPYVTYRDDANSSKATVMKFNGSAWVNVGSAGFSAGTANQTSIVIDGSGTSFVAFMDGANSNKATVMKYDGSAWVLFGNAGFSSGQADNIRIAINSSGVPYVSYSDLANSTKMSVKGWGICDPSSSTINPIVCDSYTSPSGNNTWTTSGNYQDIIPNSCGSDSTITINLTVNYSNTGTDVQTACDSYTWIDGNTYTSSNNTATYTITNQAGCDSLVTLDLTIQQSATANAGSDDEITLSTIHTYPLNGTASNQQSVLWTTSGNGTFDNATSLITFYTVGSGDITGGSVVLTLTSYPVSPCVNVDDDMTLDIISTPVNQASDIVLSNVQPTEMSINWTVGSGTKRAVFATEIGPNRSLTAQPVDGTTYTASSVFGSGTQIGTSGWYCIYNGNGSSTTVTGLIANTNYKLMVCEYNGLPGSEYYNTSSLTNNPQQITSVPISNWAIYGGILLIFGFILLVNRRRIA